MEKLKYRVIKNKGQYKEYCEELEALVFSGSKDKNVKGEIDLLTVLIEKWDTEHNTFDELDPIQLLQSFMADHELKSKDLVEILGVSKGYISEILHYKKGLSKEVIRRLAEYFKVSQEAFNRPYKLVSSVNAQQKNASVMRSLVCLAVSFTLLQACNKSASSSQPGIQFKMNGVQIQLTGGLDSTQRDPITGYYYGCYATKYVGSNFYTLVGESSNCSVLLGIETQQGSLATITYNGGLVDPGFIINDTSYGINHSGDGMSITIARYSNGTIDGTFFGTVSTHDSIQKNITQGQFSNLKIGP